MQTPIHLKGVGLGVAFEVWLGDAVELSTMNAVAGLANGVAVAVISVAIDGLLIIQRDRINRRRRRSRQFGRVLAQR